MPVKAITGTHVYLYYQCAHTFAQACRLPKPERVPDPARELVMKLGVAHEARYVEAMREHLEAHGERLEEPAFPPFAFAQGQAATIQLMLEGVRVIYQGALTGTDDATGLPCVGLPDLMERVDDVPSVIQGEPRPYSYVVGDVKSSVHAKMPQVLQAALYARLLAKIQGVLPAKGFIVLGSGEREYFRTAEVDDLLGEVLAELAAIWRDPDAASTRPHWQPMCEGCDWFPTCEAALADDVSRVAGVSPARAARLRAAGVATLPAVAQLSGPVADFEPGIIHRLRAQAAAQLAGEAQVLAPAKLAPERACDPRGEFYFAIAADPFTDCRFAFAGLAVLGGEVVEQQVSYARTPAEELDALREFSQFYKHHQAHPLFHFQLTGVRHLQALMARYPKTFSVLKVMEYRMVDLYQALRRAALLPVGRYDLAAARAFLAGRGLLPEPPALPPGGPMIWYQQAQADPAQAEASRAAVAACLLDELATARALKGWLAALGAEAPVHA